MKLSSFKNCIAIKSLVMIHIELSSLLRIFSGKNSLRLSIVKLMLFMKNILWHSSWMIILRDFCYVNILGISFHRIYLNCVTKAIKHSRGWKLFFQERLLSHLLSHKFGTTKAHSTSKQHRFCILYISYFSIYYLCIVVQMEWIQLSLICNETWL